MPAPAGIFTAAPSRWRRSRPPGAGRSPGVPLWRPAPPPKRGSAWVPLPARCSRAERAEHPTTEASSTRVSPARSRCTRRLPPLVAVVVVDMSSHGAGEPRRQQGRKVSAFLSPPLGGTSSDGPADRADFPRPKERAGTSARPACASTDASLLGLGIRLPGSCPASSLTPPSQHRSVRPPEAHRQPAGTRALRRLGSGRGSPRADGDRRTPLR